MQCSERTNSNLNMLIDRSQIGYFENLYRELEVHVNSLVPYVGFNFDSLNVSGMIYTMRNLQSRLEDILFDFSQNLPEREQHKVIFTLPQFQNCSFLQAINRSLNISKNISKGQGLTINSFIEQCSPPLVNSPNVTFSPQMTSSPKSMARNSLEGNDYGSFSS